jgi:DNA-binding transcriptional LysR family regulator
MAMDRLAAMQTFVRVVESGSFSGAARAVNLGQPAVSKTVAQLEARLGVRLLMRSSHGLTPTEAGQNFYDRAKRVIEDAEEAEVAARGVGASLTGRLRVAGGVTFSCLHVVPRLTKFLETHPGLTVDVLLDDRPLDLIAEGVDVALRPGTALPDSSTLTARKLASAPRHVWGTPAYFARSGVPASPIELTRHQTIVFTQDRGGGDVWRFRQGDHEISVNVTGLVRVSAAEGIRAAVLADMGLSISSVWMFSRELASGAVQPVLADWFLPPLDLWAVYPTGRMPSVKARTFAAFVEAELKAADFRL